MQSAADRSLQVCDFLQPCRSEEPAASIYRMSVPVYRTSHTRRLISSVNVLGGTVVRFCLQEVALCVEFFIRFPESFLDSQELKYRSAILPAVFDGRGTGPRVSVNVVLIWVVSPARDAR